MRVISGSYKNREIQAPKGKATRPVLTRVRKAIFSMADRVLPGARVLDLFSGSGGFVIEALSRGAKSAVAIDLDLWAIKAIRANLAHCQVKEPVRIYKNDAFDAIAKLGKKGEQFELIVVAPPYWKGLQARALEAVDAADLLAPGGLLFEQRDAKEDLELAAPLTRLALWKKKVYGNTAIEWFMRAEEIPAAPSEDEPEVDEPEAETEEPEPA